MTNKTKNCLTSSLVKDTTSQIEVSFRNPDKTYHRNSDWVSTQLSCYKQ